MSEHQLLWRARLLDTYAADAGEEAALERTALRGESHHMRDIFAHAASYGTLTYEELVRRISTGQLCGYSIEPNWLARLAEVCALQSNDDQDTAIAWQALRLANQQLALSRQSPGRFTKLETELLYEQGQFQELDAFLAEHRELRSLYYDYLRVDSRNPFLRDDLHGDSEARWLRGFNRQFIARGLLPVHLATGSEAPFNRLRTRADDHLVHEEPLATVIMTTFKPQREDVLQSARSILQQTWQNLELLIVDDASPVEYSPVLDQLKQLDSRVRIIRLDTNGGTYAARNVGIAEAQGEVVTGQDADDWSHPERIEIQLRDLIENPDLPGNQVNTVNMTEDLLRIRRGYSPFIPSAPTLMVRTHILRQLGGYIPARKAADNEMRGRVAAYAGVHVHSIKLPLIFMRILPDSLSRADFRAGWQHPARRVFWSHYKNWHAQATRERLCLTPLNPAPIDIPSRFTSPPAERNQLDVVFAADWCEYGNLQADMIDEVYALLGAGLRVGVVHLENARYLSRTARTLCRPIHDLISSGHVTSVLLDEDFHDVSLLVLRSPELLQFMPGGTAAFRPNSTAVVAETPPVSADGWTVTYIPEECSRHAEEFFGSRPLWVPASEAVARALAPAVPEHELRQEKYTPPFDLAPWRARRDRLRNIRPVIGAWAGNHPTDWPKAPEVIHQLLPSDDDIDVRLYGNATTLGAVLQGDGLPPQWITFSQESIHRDTYYRSIDFFLHYPQHPPPTPQRSVLEAMAAGCVVLLPPSLEAVFGKAAVYAAPEDAQAVIRAHVEDPVLYRLQSQRAAAFPQGHGGDAFVHTITALMHDSARHPQEITIR